MELDSRLGSYEVAEPSDAGGVGEVWLAQDTGLGRRAAIKVPPEDFADRSAHRCEWIRVRSQDMTGTSLRGAMPCDHVPFRPSHAR